MAGQDQRRPWALAEVEVGGEVAELGAVLAHVGSGVGASVGCGVDPLAAEEVVFDELQVRVEAQCLMVD